MPDPSPDQRAAWFQAEVEGRRVLLLPVFMPEVGGYVRFIGTLVLGKPDIPVDAHHGPSHCARVRNNVGIDFVQAWSEVRDEAQQRVSHLGFVALLVFLEPVAVVMSAELAQKVE